MRIVDFLQYFLMHSRPFFLRETISTFQPQLITPMKKLSLSMYQLFPKFPNKDKSYPRLVGIGLIANTFFRTRKTTFNLEDFEKTAKKIDLRHSLTRFHIDLRLSKPQR